MSIREWPPVGVVLKNDDFTSCPPGRVDRWNKLCWLLDNIEHPGDRRQAWKMASGLARATGLSADEVMEAAVVACEDAADSFELDGPECGELNDHVYVAYPWPGWLNGVATDVVGPADRFEPIGIGLICSSSVSG